MTDLTPEESQLLKKLPQPPPLGNIRVNGVLILEWLQAHPDEPRTGQELHEWIDSLRPGWSTYVICRTKADLLAAIRDAASRDETPILHIECHGGSHGLGDGGNSEILTWDELTAPLQNLNEARGCNLMLFIAACIGFSGIVALASGPRAPAVALVGPADTLTSDEITSASKAFYRTLIEGNTNLQSMSDASTKHSGVLFEPESIALLAFESLAERMIVDARPENRIARMDRMRVRLMEQCAFSDAEVESRMAEFDAVEAQTLQMIWDHFFMLDKHRTNASRFELDVPGIARQIAAYHGRPC